jgi:hypothetical protein
MKALRNNLRRNETGAALAETAITIMTFLVVILGIIQMTLVINAKLMVNYAAYHAARAGIVYNGDQDRMNEAAAAALAPLFTGAPSLTSLALGYGRARAEMAISLLQVEILSPSSARFRNDYRKRFFPEIQRYGEAPSDGAFLDDNLLTVKVTYYYPLRIPLINQILRPFFQRVKITSTYRMRMQSDAITEQGRST